MDPVIAAVSDAVRPRALLLFGSCLSPATKRPGSIPDLLALVDDRDAVLSRLGAGVATRWLARVLPPLILAFPGPGGATVAKLNLIEPTEAARALRELPDLYLAGRLSKHTALVYARDTACGAEAAVLLDQAAEAMVSLTLAALPRRCSLEEAMLACLHLSYQAELRPERADKIQALYDAFAADYQARYLPLFLAAARRVGWRWQDEHLLDDRPDETRATSLRALRQTIRRSRRRFLWRMARQALVYRGALAYVIAKVRRARAA